MLKHGFSIAVGLIVRNKNRQLSGMNNWALLCWGANGRYHDVFRVQAGSFLMLHARAALRVLTGLHSGSAVAKLLAVLGRSSLATLTTRMYGRHDTFPILTHLAFIARLKAGRGLSLSDEGGHYQHRQGHEDEETHP